MVGFIIVSVVPAAENVRIREYRFPHFLLDDARLGMLDYLLNGMFPRVFALRIRYKLIYILSEFSRKIPIATA